MKHAAHLHCALRLLALAGMTTFAACSDPEEPEQPEARIQASGEALPKPFDSFAYFDYAGWVAQLPSSWATLEICCDSDHFVALPIVDAQMSSLNVTVEPKHVVAGENGGWLIRSVHLPETEFDDLRSLGRSIYRSLKDISDHDDIERSVSRETYVGGRFGYVSSISHTDGRTTLIVWSFQGEIEQSGLQFVLSIAPNAHKQIYHAFLQSLSPRTWLASFPGGRNTDFSVHVLAIGPAEIEIREPDPERPLSGIMVRVMPLSADLTVNFGNTGVKAVTLGEGRADFVAFSLVRWRDAKTRSMGGGFGGWNYDTVRLCNMGVHRAGVPAIVPNLDELNWTFGEDPTGYIEGTLVFDGKFDALRSVRIDVAEIPLHVDRALERSVIPKRCLMTVSSNEG